MIIACFRPDEFGWNSFYLFSVLLTFGAWGAIVYRRRLPRWWLCCGLVCLAFGVSRVCNACVSGLTVDGGIGNVGIRVDSGCVRLYFTSNPDIRDRGWSITAPLAQCPLVGRAGLAVGEAYLGFLSPRIYHAVIPLSVLGIVALIYPSWQIAIQAREDYRGRLRGLSVQ